MGSKLSGNRSHSTRRPGGGRKRQRLTFRKLDGTYLTLAEQKRIEAAMERLGMKQEIQGAEK